MASFVDIHDDMFIKAIMNEQGVPVDGSWEAWIGLYYDRNADNTPNPDPDADPDDNKNSVKWRWTDKHPVTYTNWGKNQPQPNSNAKGCVVINGNGGWYVTDTCDAAKPYLCKLDASHNPDEHEDPGEDICLDEEISYKGYCYSRSVGYYTFEEAEKKCAESNGAKVSSNLSFDATNPYLNCFQLASIHDDNERRFLASVDEWDGDSWIGLKRNENGGFEWIDNSPVDYTSWRDGEPNNGGTYSPYGKEEAAWVI